jgi:hypothetical protein
MRVGLEFKPQDLWIGAYWEHRRGKVVTPAIPDVCWRDLHLWVCVVPMCPLHFVWEGGPD